MINPKRDRIPVVPRDELECIWMRAGIVTYKLCDAHYDCEHCSFDQAMNARGKTYPSQLEIMGFLLWSAFFYHPSHIWAAIEEGGQVRIGVDDFAQKLLGPIYNVSFPKKGSKMIDGSIQVRARDTDISLPTPAEGYIIDVNKQLLTLPDLINRYPYDKGWLVLIRPVHLLKNLQGLYYGVQAEQWYRREIARLHARMAQVVDLQPTPVGATMQDGGTPLIDLLGAMTQKEAEEIIEQFFTPNPSHGSSISPPT